jgi:hypothetical protein
MGSCFCCCCCWVRVRGVRVQTCLGVAAMDEVELVVVLEEEQGNEQEEEEEATTRFEEIEVT